MLLQDRRQLGEVGIADLDPERKVGAYIEGRVDVDESDLTGVLAQQTAHHELVVAPDEGVPVAAQGVVARQQGPAVALSRRSGLVDRLDGLERQVDPLDAGRLALPFEADAQVIPPPASLDQPLGAV